MTDMKTYNSVQTKWLKEIRADEKLKTLPLILVATKCDQLEEHYTLESFKRVDTVDLDHASNLAKQEGFVTFLQTSALFGDCVKNVFDEAVFSVLKTNTKLGGNGSQSGRLKKG